MATGDEGFSPMHLLLQENPRSHQTLENDDVEVFGDNEPENQIMPDSYIAGCSFCGEHCNPTSRKRTQTNAQELERQSDRVSSGQSYNSSVEDLLLQKVDDLIGLIKNDLVADDKIIAECFAVMDELVASGILAGELYIPAMKALSDKADYRKFFLKMPSNELKLSFINSIIGNM